ncbi:MAG TPA: DinB family protein [Phycisphaerae bacterium]|nr:DinB family protein [Phycisphaerae bacterium]
MNFAPDSLLAEDSRQSDPSIFQAIRAVIESLDALDDFISDLPDMQYAAKPANDMASVGSHVRHSLDHVAALVRGLADGFVDYDARQRGTEIERSPSAARERLAELRGVFERSVPVKERYLSVRSMLTPDGETVRAHSSWSRELVFVLNHTTHHQAMMAVAAQALGACVDPRFGFAPSTLAYLDRTPCVQSA